MPSVFRFAPSPNGYLHVGHAFSALLNAKMARAAKGQLLLRIEDIDATRCRPAFETAIYEDLAWLGVTWEQSVRRQSEHFDDYRTELNRLEAMGLVYPSFESRAEIAAQVAKRETKGPWPRDPDGAPLYPGNVKAIPLDERIARMKSGAPYALRLDMKTALARVGSLSWDETGAGPGSESGTIKARPEVWGDVILARKEVSTSYHLAVVVDDAAQGVTDVVRGRDLFHATSVHCLLQTLLGLPAPRYHHHRLLFDAEGKKLSKSTSATALRELRARGLKPNEIFRMIGPD